MRSGALWALAAGGWAIGTGEFVIMGLLPEMARDTGTSIPEAGHLISGYALGVMVGAPILAVVTARWPRRALLIALLMFYALANLATALLPGYAALAATRLAAGLPHGAYFGVAALVAAALSPPGHRARAVGFVMLGLAAALLAGAPLGTWLGQHFGWRAAFAFVGCASLACAMAVRFTVPQQPRDPHATPLRELGALARSQVWLTLAIAGIGFGGMFCVISYIKPALVEVSGFDAGGVPLALALFGLGAVAANLVGARLADKAPLRTIGAVLAYAAVLLAGFGALLQQVPSALAAVFLLGGIIGLGPALQVRLMDVAGDAQTLAAALNHSAFNFANALGAWLGGVAIAAGWGWGSLGWVGSALAVAGLLVLLMSLAAQKALSVKPA